MLRGRGLHQNSDARGADFCFLPLFCSDLFLFLFLFVCLFIQFRLFLPKPRTCRLDSLRMLDYLKDFLTVVKSHEI